MFSGLTPKSYEKKMKKNVVVGWALAVSGLAGTVAAQTATQEAGSDTLYEFATVALAECARAGFTTGLSYIGGGTTRGESEMVAGRQSVAPMSRFLNAAACAADPAGDGADGECKLVGLDGLAIYASGTCADCETGGGTGATSVANLRTIYFGVGAAGTWGTQAACSNAARVALAQNWGSVTTSGGAGCSDCQLLHAYRRDDLSGTTDSFRSLMGIPTAVDVNADGRPDGNLFCNGTANDRRVEDQDPIRRTCENDDVICSRHGTFGLVKPILVPEPPVAADRYPSCTPCTLGFFRLAPAQSVVLAGGVTQYNCPETGIASCPQLTAPRYGFSQGGFCYAPAINNAGVPNFSCTNSRNNNGVYAVSTQDDSRIYNSFTRRADGSLVSVTAPGMFYRSDACGAGNCQQASATDQIACLAAKDACAEDATPTAPIVNAALGCPVGGASPSCPSVGRSLGFAGIGADSNVPAARKLLVSNGAAGVCPTVANIQSFAYPGARRVYVCSIEGFSDVIGGSSKDENFAECLTANPVTAAGSPNGCLAGESVIECSRRIANFVSSPQIGQNSFCPGP
jgi:hypothetical protein